MTKQRNMKVANEILRQLGGNKFIVMTGAKVYSDGVNNETLVIKFKGCKTINLLHITLTSSDLYTMKFSKFSGMKVTPRTEICNVYADMLKSIFTKETGLYTSL